MQFTPTKASKVFAAELADDMLGKGVFVVLVLALEEWLHGIDLMLQLVFPVYEVFIALLAVEVIWLILLVALHLLLRVKGLPAPFIGA